MPVDISRYTHAPLAGPTCGVGQLLATSDDAATLAQILDDPRLVFSQFEIHSKADFGVRIAASTVSRHVRGRCACG